MTHDWPQIIKDLEANGITMYKIGLMIGLGYSQIKNWRNGDITKMHGPRYAEGKLLLELHEKHVPRETARALVTQTPINSSNPTA